METNFVNWQDYNTSLLAVVAYREARGEGPEGIRAVMNVIKNRVNAGWGDWSKVITGRNQFTSISVPGNSQTVIWPAKPDPIFDTCMAIATDVMAGTSADNTGGALYYGNPRDITSSWFINNVVNKRPKTASIGLHDFYK